MAVASAPRTVEPPRERQAAKRFVHRRFRVLIRERPQRSTAKKARVRTKVQVRAPGVNPHSTSAQIT